MFSARHVMRPVEEDEAVEACWDLIAEGVQVDADATLEVAMPLFEVSNHAYVPVVVQAEDGGAPELLGALFQVDALRAYNRALAATAAEEHS